jgi:hypothetical protein
MREGPKQRTQIGEFSEMLEFGGTQPKHLARSLGTRSRSPSSGSDSEDDSVVLQSTVTDLNASLSAFEHAHLQPLLAASLKDTLGQVEGDIDRAKLLVTLGYVIEDLVWSESLPYCLLLVGLGLQDGQEELTYTRPTSFPLTLVYLKTKGINPETHPVVPELQRIKSYFTKIQTAVNPPKRPSLPLVIPPFLS